MTDKYATNKLKKYSKIKVAIVGCGKIAGVFDDPILPEVVRTHALAYTRDIRTRLVAVGDIDSQRAKKFAKHWKADSYYTDIREMLDRSSPQIVSICSPDPTHLAVLEECLKHDSVKAAWCEKPLVTSYNQAKSIIRQYERSGKYLFVNYQRNYDPVINDYQTRFEEELGEVQKVTAFYTKGVLHNGSHIISLLVEWFGKAQEIEFLCGDLSSSKSCDPNVDALLKFKNFPAYLIGLDKDAYSLFEIQCYGTLGALCLTNRSGKERLILSKVICDPKWRGFDILDSHNNVKNTGSDKAFSYVLSHIIETMSDKSKVSYDVTLETMRICHELSTLNSTGNI